MYKNPIPENEYHQSIPKSLILKYLKPFTIHQNDDTDKYETKMDLFIL